MNKTRLIFVRHAEAEGNFHRIFHGFTDSAITDKGHMQAQKVADILKTLSIDALYSSSAKRTMQTAGYIASTLNLTINIEPTLREINGGDWEDQKWCDLSIKWPQEFHTWENMPHIHQMPGGENMEEFYERLLNTVNNIIMLNKYNNICIVTHGTAIRALLCYFTKCGLENMVDINWCDNTSVTIVDIYDDALKDNNFKVIKNGCTLHLPENLKSIWW